jgi:hypothetical protein
MVPVEAVETALGVSGAAAFRLTTGFGAVFFATG